MTAETVVFLPRRSLALISRTLSLSPGCTAFRRLDLPAPEGPVTNVMRPATAAAQAPSPGRTEFRRLALPAPEGPVTTEMRPASAAAKASIPSPVFTLVG